VCERSGAAAAAVPNLDNLVAPTSVGGEARVDARRWRQSGTWCGRRRCFVRPQYDSRRMHALLGHAARRNVGDARCRHNARLCVVQHRSIIYNIKPIIITTMSHNR
jgi:hypothetical protein